MTRLTFGGSIAAAAAAIAAGALTAAPVATSVALASMHGPLPGTSAPAAPAPKTCAPNFVSGTIGGQPKCLAAGELCQQANAADYTKYGFSCDKVGNRFQLSKKGAGTAKPPAKPAPTPPAKTSPKPAPPSGH